MAQLPVRRSGRNITVVNPTREFEDIYNRMGQLMNFAFGMAPVAFADAPWVPFADMSETDDSYVVQVELPGVTKNQVDVQLMDRELVVGGEIPESESAARSHRNTRRTGRFEYRTFLPGDVKGDAVRAQLTDGVLTVTVPKSDAAKPRKIEITG